MVNGSDWNLVQFNLKIYFLGLILFVMEELIRQFTNEKNMKKKNLEKYFKVTLLEKKNNNPHFRRFNKYFDIFKPIFF